MAIQAPNYVSSQRLYRMMINGARHVVSIRQLKKLGYLPDHVPDTKEATYKGAIKYFEDLRVKLQTEHPHHASTQTLDKLARFYSDKGMIDKGFFSMLGGKILEENPTIPTDDAHTFIQGMDNYTEVHSALEEIEHKPAPGTVKTLEWCVQHWLDNAVTPRANSGQISGREIVNHKYGVRLLTEWAGDDTLIEAVGNPQKWQEFFAYLCSKIKDGIYKPTYCKHGFRYCRDFLDYCTEQSWIPTIPNLRSRKMSIPITTPVKDYFTNNDIIMCLKWARGRQFELHLLLMLNCGMTQQDVSDLTWQEWDKKNGRIIRKRSKGQKRATVPIVNYKLWERTQALLLQWQSKDPIRVLTTSTGRLWVDKDNGKDVDNVANYWDRLVEATNIVGSLRMFRRTAAQRIENSPYSSYAQYFLGQAPNTVAQTHYTTPTVSQLDKTIEWLHHDLGIDGLFIG